MLGLAAIVPTTPAAARVRPARRAACDPRVPSTCTLRQLADRAGIRIGATLEPDQIDDPAYADTLAREFSSLTPENAMKWYAIQDQRGVFTFDGADAVVAFAEAHGMAVRGHNLVWAQDQFTPDWVQGITDPSELWAAVTGEVDAVMGRYRGRVHRYDVLNEPIASLGTGPSASVFHRVLGPTWIADLFRYAHSVDPTAELWLNEFGSDFVPGKRAALVDLVAGLVRDGVPIDGVGIQTHRYGTAGPDPDSYETMLRELTDLGVEVAVTELDVATDPAVPTAFADQARAYDRIVRACLAVRGCTEVTTWGLTDASTWLDSFAFLPHPARPLLFDDAYRPKPAYDAVRLALADRVLGRGQATTTTTTTAVPSSTTTTIPGAAGAVPIGGASAYTG